MKIPEDVLQVLTDPRTVIEGDRVQIPFELDRSLYQRVNRILKEAGGAWDGRKAVRAHTFPHPVGDFMHQALLAGEFPSRQDLGWFPTPPTVVNEILGLANLRPGMTVLEPSAGTGAIAGPAASCGALVDCVEIEPRRAASLRERCQPRRVVQDDFLNLNALDYDTGFRRVLMNPPFHSALAHVKHAIGFMGEDALLVAVMSEGITWHSSQANVKFRQLVARAEGEFIPLPHDAFDSSGVTVRTVLLVLESGAAGAILPTHAWRRAQPRQLDLFAF